MTLTVSDLTGGYQAFPVLHDISFTVPAGQLIGLIGLNGAGKSTTIKHIIGLLAPIKGSIALDDLDLATSAGAYKQKLAYIPESPILYPELTLKEHIELTIKAYDLDQAAAWAKAKQLLKEFRLENKLDWFPANFSKGMKQKVMIVCAFITDAALFVIDEPFLGLDPLAIDSLLHEIKQQTKKDKAVLMSTHVLATAQQYCDAFVLINHGRKIAAGTLKQLQAQFKEPNADLNAIYLTMVKQDVTAHE